MIAVQSRHNRCIRISCGVKYVSSFGVTGNAIGKIVESNRHAWRRWCGARLLPQGLSTGGMRNRRKRHGARYHPSNQAPKERLWDLRGARAFSINRLHWLRYISTYRCELKVRGLQQHCVSREQSLPVKRMERCDDAMSRRRCAIAGSHDKGRPLDERRGGNRGAFHLLIRPALSIRLDRQQ